MDVCTASRDPPRLWASCTSASLVNTEVKRKSIARSGLVATSKSWPRLAQNSKMCEADDGCVSGSTLITTPPASSGEPCSLLRSFTLVAPAPHTNCTMAHPRTRESRRRPFGCLYPHRWPTVDAVSTHRIRCRCMTAGKQTWILPALGSL